MKRGQAFETMMLVVSVIVALAILAVLMNILGIIKLFNPSDPKAVMHDGLKEVQSKGYGITIPKKTTFSTSTFLARELLSDIPIPETWVGFYCEEDESGLCGSGDDAFINVPTAGGKQLTVKKTVEAYVAVCGDQSSIATTHPKYCIAVAIDAEKASSDCMTKCGL